MKCTRGHKLPKGDTFCHYCGAFPREKKEKKEPIKVIADAVDKVEKIRCSHCGSRFVILQPRPKKNQAVRHCPSCGVDLSLAIAIKKGV